MTEIESIRTAIIDGAAGSTAAARPRPRAATCRHAGGRAGCGEMFPGLPAREEAPRNSTRVADVPLPELAPDEAYIAVMASAINFNTVWTSIFEPLPTFQFLKR